MCLYTLITRGVRNKVGLSALGCNFELGAHRIPSSGGRAVWAKAHSVPKPNQPHDDGVVVQKIKRTSRRMKPPVCLWRLEAAPLRSLQNQSRFGHRPSGQTG